jgi:hypothetical protein
MTAEKLQPSKSEKKYRDAPRLYREFTNSFTIPSKRIKKLALRAIKILKRKIKGGVNK